MMPVFVCWIGYSHVLQILNHRAHHIMVVRLFRILLQGQLIGREQSLEYVHYQFRVFLIPKIDVDGVYFVF
jgi:hypothetical protein